MNTIRSISPKQLAFGTAYDVNSPDQKVYSYLKLSDEEWREKKDPQNRFWNKTLYDGLEKDKFHNRYQQWFNHCWTGTEKQALGEIEAELKPEVKKLEIRNLADLFEKFPVLMNKKLLRKFGK